MAVTSAVASASPRGRQEIVFLIRTAAPVEPAAALPLWGFEWRLDDSRVISQFRGSSEAVKREDFASQPRAVIMILDITQ